MAQLESQHLLSESDRTPREHRSAVPPWDQPCPRPESGATKADISRWHDKWGSDLVCRTRQVRCEINQSCRLNLSSELSSRRLTVHEQIPRIPAVAPNPTVCEPSVVAPSSQKVGSSIETVQAEPVEITSPAMTQLAIARGLNTAKAWREPRSSARAVAAPSSIAYDRTTPL